MNFLGMGKDCGWCDDESSSSESSSSSSSSSQSSSSSSQSASSSQSSSGSSSSSSSFIRDYSGPSLPCLLFPAVPLVYTVNYQGLTGNGCVDCSFANYPIAVNTLGSFDAMPGPGGVGYCFFSGNLSGDQLPGGTLSFPNQCEFARPLTDTVWDHASSANVTWVGFWQGGRQKIALEVLKNWRISDINDLGSAGDFAGSATYQKIWDVVDDGLPNSLGSISIPLISSTQVKVSTGAPFAICDNIPDTITVVAGNHT